jgi:hypothetical protein
MDINTHQLAIRCPRSCFKLSMLLIVAAGIVAPQQVNAAAEDGKVVGPDQAAFEKSVSRG